MDSSRKLGRKSCRRKSSTDTHWHIMFQEQKAARAAELHQRQRSGVIDKESIDVRSLILKQVGQGSTISPPPKSAACTELSKASSQTEQSFSGTWTYQSFRQDLLGSIFRQRPMVYSQSNLRLSGLHRKLPTSTKLWLTYSESMFTLHS